MFMEEGRPYPAGTARSNIVSAEEEITQPLTRRLPPDLADRVRQGNLLRARLDTVLRVAAGGDAARAHERLEALGGDVAADGVQVGEQRLTDGRGADEVVAARHLRADLETAAAGDALIEPVHELLEIGGDARPRSEVVGAVDRHPGLHALESLEHPPAIDD